jgi:hypothetical protein
VSARAQTRSQRALSFYAEPFYRANGYEIIRRARDRDGSEYLEMVKRF